MKNRILIWILFGLVWWFIFLVCQGCASLQYSTMKISTVRPLVENEYEIAGKEIYEGMMDD